MNSVGGAGNGGGGGQNDEDNTTEVKAIRNDEEAPSELKSTSSYNGAKSRIIPVSSVPQVFGMGTGNREGLRLSLDNSLSGGANSSIMLTTPTMTSTNLSPGGLLLPPSLLTPGGTVNLLNTPTSSSVLGLVASSPAGAPTLTTPTLTPTTLRNIEQMFLEHDELGFGGSHSSESHENAAHFVPPPVAADDFSRSLKDEVGIKEEKSVTSISTITSSYSAGKCNHEYILNIIYILIRG